MAENIMPEIPGEYLSPARYWLPPPETAGDETHQVQCVLPRFGAVRITRGDRLLAAARRADHQIVTAAPS
jgi:hypothetical protein